MSMALVDQSVVDGDVVNYGMEDSRSITMPAKRSINWLLLLLYSTFAVVGAIGGPLLQRLYYMHGGSRKWLSSWLQCVGFILLVIPISFLYLKELSSKRNITSKVYFFMEPKLLLSSAVIGILIGLDNYMYSAGLSYIPVSTSALLFSTQLAFTALFAFFIVKQKFTFYSLNSVIVMTLGAVVLALHTSGDRPPGVSKEKYLLGFFFTLGGAALLGLSMPLVEKAYSKSSRPIDYLMVLQFQFVMNFFATCVCTIGMLINKDFKIISREASLFAIGEIKYYLIIVLQKQRAEFRVSKFLSGLRPEFAHVKSQVQVESKLPTLSEAYSRISRITSPSKTIDSAALIVPPSNNNNNFSFGRGSGGRGGRTSRGRGRGRSMGGWPPCDHCGRTNHGSNFCWEAFGRPSLSKANNVIVYDHRDTDSVQKVQEDLAALMKRIQAIPASPSSSSNSPTTTLAESGSAEKGTS